MGKRIISSLLALSAVHLTFAASRQDYINNAIDAANILCASYNTNNGLFDGGDGTAGWWTSANALTTIGNLAALDVSLLGTAEDIFSCTFSKAPYAPVAAQYNVQRGTFLDDYFDDQGWWALAWLKAYDVSGNVTYLEEAKTIFADIDAATNGHCGGRPWCRIDEDNQINSITNELYFALAASLANRVSDNKDFYVGLASYQADWFYNSGLLDSGGNDLIVDALDVSNCQPNRSGIVWTYNQGAILGAFVEMHRLTGDQKFLDSAHRIAQGVTSHMVSSDGILTEYGYPDVQEGAEQFKGVFARNLIYLHQASPDQGYADFLMKNADSISKSARAGDGRIGVNWQGPVQSVDAVSHGSGLDCLVGAAAVAT